MLVLKPRQTAISPEVQQFFDRINMANLDLVHYRGYIRLIDGLVADGIWQLLDCLYIFATVDAATALTNLLDMPYAATAVNNPTFTPDRGFNGNGTDSYINTGYRAGTTNIAPYVGPAGSGSTIIWPRAQAQSYQNAHFAVWLPDEDGTMDQNGTSGPFLNSMILSPAGATIQARINTMSLPPVVIWSGPPRFAGFWHIHRWGSQPFEQDTVYCCRTGWWPDTLPAWSSTNGMATLPLFLGAHNERNAGAWYFHTQCYAMMSAGEFGVDEAHGLRYRYYLRLRGFMEAVGIVN